MANEQHVKWFMEGVGAWNRRRGPGGDLDDVEVDLSGVDFRWLFESIGLITDNGHIPLGGYNLSNANLSYANLTGAQFIYADFTGANLIDANFTNSIVLFSKFTRACLGGSILTGSHFNQVDLTNAELAGAEFTGAKLHHSVLTDALCSDTNFAGASLDRTRLLDAALFNGDIEVFVQHPITLYHVKSVADLLARIGTIKTCYEDCKDAPRFYFRGESQCGWDLRPSVMRDPIFAENESAMLTDLISRRPEDFNGLVSGMSRLVTAQHHGLKTRFLDITSNPLVALFHACGEVKDQKDGRLHAFAVPHRIIKPFNSDTVSVIANYARLSTYHQKALIGEYSERSYYPTAMEQLYQLIQSEKPYFVSRIDPRDFYRVIIVEPQKSSERIRAQSGAFLVSAFHQRFEQDEILRWNDGIPVYDHYQLTIPGECKADILDELRMLNITRETLFPGLDSSAEAITELYSPSSE